MRIAVLAASLAVVAAGQAVSPIRLLEEAVDAADHRLRYGPGDLHFGELRLPGTGTGPHPVVILIHGGCWADTLPKLDPRATSMDLLRPMAAALTAAGAATWNIEYRRAGPSGGGWPASFEDLSRAVDFVREIAGKYRLDVNRVVVAGHSSGGHLAMWVAARHRLAPTSAFYTKDPLRVKAVVNLDGPADPAAFQPFETKVCSIPAVTQFLGGTPSEVPERYRDASPASFLPLGIPQEFIVGSLIRRITDQIAAYESLARSRGDAVTITALDGAGHFDMLAPRSPHWPTVAARFKTLLQ
jgi:acetyl esterase/lipase